MCVRVCVCGYVQEHACMWLDFFQHVVCVCVCARARACVCVCVRARACTRVHVSYIVCSHMHQFPSIPVRLTFAYLTMTRSRALGRYACLIIVSTNERTVRIAQCQHWLNTRCTWACTCFHDDSRTTTLLSSIAHKYSWRRAASHEF